MGVLDIILISLLLLSGVVVIISVLLQHGKSDGLSGTITGTTTETYFGKANGGARKEKLLSRITIYSSVIFVLLVLVVYVIQSEGGNNITPF